MKHLAYLASLVAGASLFTACALECTEVGCVLDEGVQVNLLGVLGELGSSAPLTIEVCVDDACHPMVAYDNAGSFNCDSEGPTCSVLDSDLQIAVLMTVPDEVTVTVTVSDANGTVLFEGSEDVSIEDTAPNGEECGPICRSGSASFTVGPASQ